jgi:hypothetical protein
MKLTNYESDTTKFIREFLERNPEVVEKQQAARRTWWDRPQDFVRNQEREGVEVPQRGYAYYSIGE